jgi:hypothetical protein
MRKLTFLSMFFFPFFATAQNIWITSQAQLDGYQFDGYCGCHLYIGPDDTSSVESDIHDLSPLLGLTGIYGILEIRNNPHLKSLHGLENLSYFYDGSFSKLEIRNNDSLLTLTGLPDSIGYVGGSRMLFHITDNELLASLVGMPTKGTQLIYGINLWHNPRLQDLHGLEGYGSPMQLYLWDCAQFERLEGFGSVDSIGWLRIEDCPRLKDFTGLSGLTYAGSIELENLDSLENTAGMPNLQNLQSRFTAKNCPRFTQIAGMQNLRGSQWVLFAVEDCDRMADFSEWSDSIMVSNFTYRGNDSVEVVTGLHRVHAGVTDISGCNSLRHLPSIPTGLVYDTNGPVDGPTFELTSCPNLEVIGNPDGMEQPAEWVDFKVWLENKVNDISGLSFLKRITHNFLLWGTSLTNLHGLENLEDVKYANIYDNAQLSDISALSSLRKAGAFEMSFCNVSNLNGLENLEEVDWLYLAETPLEDLSILNDTKINQSLILVALPNIDTIQGFSNMDTIGIVVNDSVWYPGQVQIYDMPNLRHIAGFDNLRRIQKSGYDGSTGTAWASVGIYENPQLESITGFSHLRNADGGLTLRDNPLLSDASGLCPWLKLGQVGAGSMLSGNPPGYNSLAQLKAGCDTVALGSKEMLIGKTMLSVSPNPADQEATVDITTTSDYAYLDRLELRLLDVTGRCVGKWRLHPYSSLVRIETGHLPSGLYYLVLRDGGLLVSSKTLVVDH